MKKVFSKFDVAKAFYSIGEREKDSHFLCTGTSFGFFLYTAAHMGLTSSPSVMTHCTNALFNSHFLSFHHSDRKEHMPEGNHAFCFIDDIILANESKEMHHKTIEVIFHICTQYGLTLKLGKCATHWLRLHRISWKQGGATG